MSDEFDITLDRDAEVPIGVQLTWALRSRILGGSLAPGARLPALQRLAEQAGVNVNTIRSVYLRLEQDGLVATRHGSGTYVVAAPRDRSALAQLVSGAADAARDAGLDPRDVAAALYVQAEGADAPAREAAARRRLRAQIAALEQTLSDVLASRPGLLPPAPLESPAPKPRLLSAAELAQQRSALLRQLAAAQAALDEPPAGPQPATTQAPGRKPSRAPSTSAKLRVAPRAG